MDEPSILDYLKAKLTPWRGPAPEIPVLEPDEQAEDREGFESGHQPEAVPREFTEPSTQSTPQPSRQSAPWPWQALLALCLALIAQLTLEPGPDRTWKIGFFLYLISFAFLIWAFWRSEWMKPSPRQGEAQSTETNTKPFVTRPVYFLLALPVTLIAFLTFGGNLFTTLNVFLWLLAIFLVMRAFWVPSSAGRSWWGRVRDFIDHPQWKLNISRWTLIVLAGLAVVVFFRAYRIDQVPPEMVSDHAEKLLDVWDVLQGQTRIFFPRNTGREAMQMYLTATIIRVFGTDYSFISLKLGTVLAGLLTLPFIYLLGVELGNRRAGFLAMIFAGIAYWPNVISRVGLRFPLYPLFVAPALYFLVRGLRRGKVNDFVLSGLALGIGLHGYTPIRVLPIVIVIAVGLFLLHRESVGNRRQVVKGLIVLTLVAMVLFLPLLRYSLEDPEMFVFRSFSRLGSVERPLPGPAWQIFFGNLWKAMIMFTWDNGEIWVHSVTHRPALDVVSAALFSLGIVLLLVRYLRKRQWFDLFLLLSVPLLMLPSVLSLAFPAENPSLNRAAGAIVPVFLILGIALDALLDVFEKKLEPRLGRAFAGGLVVVLLALSTFQNYDLVFNKYKSSYDLASWNTTEMGQVILNFTSFMGDPDSAYVVAYPHWVDTRLVAINAGYPTKDYAIWSEALNDTLSNPQSKLFLVKLDDNDSIEALRQLYPQGVLQQYISEVAGRDFYMFFVPPRVET